MNYQFRWGWFLVSFAVGVLYVYLVKPQPFIVYKYPTPYNAGKVTYSDNVGNCYKFKVETVECPKDRSHVEAQPIV